MATISAADYKQLRRTVFTLGKGKEELKARANLPNETQAMAVFQALEDDTISHFTDVKTLIDSNIGGAATSNALAQKVYAAYLQWKIGVLLGS